ncbi:MAG TPA: CBS domain-containing protein [Pseudonocardia sp.]|jgi:CBS domain-containing protein|uniref:CBS domain-containing protein n=1 Tax=Pseudonocardia sp. TaxID=60912 RepID=UPI002B4B5C7A|nr:CBS domain-containing protein [Pseudonocardia sp.]HLU54814.1 CBS domain-containing protein [Pseudonocardia sp.]
MSTGPERLAAPPETRDDDPPIRSVMSRHIVAITPDASVSTALALMASADVHHLPVFYGNRCRAVLRETDVLRHLASGRSAPADRAATPVGRLVRPVTSVDERARRSDAARCMTSAGTDVVLVIGRRGLVGIVTAADLVRSLAADPPQRSLPA